MRSYRFYRENTLIEATLVRAAETLGLARRIQESLAEMAAWECLWRPNPIH